MLFSQFCHLKGLVFDQSFPVHPLSEYRGVAWVLRTIALSVYRQYPIYSTSAILCSDRPQAYTTKFSAANWCLSMIEQVSSRFTQFFGIKIYQSRTVCICVYHLLSHLWPHKNCIFYHKKCSCGWLQYWNFWPTMWLNRTVEPCKTWQCL